MKRLLTLVLFLSSVFPQLSYWKTDPNYLKKGIDWPQKFSSCAGSQQSPINFGVANPIKANFNLTMEFADTWITNFYMINNAINFTGDISALKYTSIQGHEVLATATYLLVHAPGEHAINGTISDIEVQIVYTVNAEFVNLVPEKQAIVSFSYSASPTTSSTFFTYLNLNYDLGYKRINFLNSFSDDLVNLQTYYGYMGSLTFPNCTENVMWFVFKESAHLSTDQFNLVTSNFANNISFANGNGNNRILQDLNGRSVYMDQLSSPLGFEVNLGCWIVQIFIGLIILDR